jgi:hypothetical protein
MKQSLRLAGLFACVLIASLPQAAGAQQSVVNTTKHNVKERTVAVEARPAPMAVQIIDANGRPTDKSTLTPAQRASIDRIQAAVQDLNSAEPSNFYFEIVCKNRRCIIRWGAGDAPLH